MSIIYITLSILENYQLAFQHPETIGGRERDLIQRQVCRQT